MSDDSRQRSTSETPATVAADDSISWSWLRL